MRRVDLIARVRSYTRDLSNSIFREIDITDYINEGVDRIKQVIPEFATLAYLASNTDVPTIMPTQYHHLLAVYATSRCFSQDERNYQATTFMNEFETKLNDLLSKIQSGEVVITDADGNAITTEYVGDYVDDNYFLKKGRYVDVDDGVNGVS